MITNFVWCQKNEHFNPEIHCRNDLDIFELNIDHREGEVAIATLTVGEVILPPYDQRHVFITYGVNLIFAGRLVGLPVKITKNLVCLEFTAEPLDADKQLQELGLSLNTAPYWDAAFVDPTEHANPSEWLEARSALFAWDRHTGHVCLSDLFEGRHVLDLTGVYFEDSLNVSLAETPLSHVSVTLIAEWIQYGSGEVSVGGKIASAFPSGMINTLTPNALQATWPVDGQKLGKSGFYVVKSHLKEMSPPKTGALHLYPTLTPEFMSWDESLQMPRCIRARRIWMKGTLVLGWEYRQKRREVVCFTLAQKTQLEGKIRPLARTLNIRLQNVGLTKESTYFQTNRGRQAVEHALEIARAHLAASARCLEVDILMPFEDGYTLTTDHSVQIADPRLPGGKVVGKVIAYQLHQDGLTSHAWVRIASSIGGKPDVCPEPVCDIYVVADYGDTARSQFHQTPSGIIYTDYSNQIAIQGLNELPTAYIGDVLKEVLVTNDSERQIHILQSKQYPVRHNLRGVLEDISTTISLNLINLKTHKEIEHVIHLQTIGAWAAPIQVNLSGD